MGDRPQTNVRHTSAKEKATLVARAERHGLTLTDVMRHGAEALLDKLDDRATAYTAIGKAGLPLSDRDTPWDAQAAKDSLSEAQYGDAFFYRDPNGDPTAIGSYKLGFAKNDGGLTAVWSGITAVAAVLQGGRGGVDIPSDDQDAIKGKVSAYYAAAKTKYNDDTINPPWEDGGAACVDNQAALAALDALSDDALADFTKAVATMTDEERDTLAAADEAHAYKPLDADQENSPCAICGEQMSADVHTTSDDAAADTDGFKVQSIQGIDMTGGITLADGRTVVFAVMPFVDVVAPEGETGDSPPAATDVTPGTPFRATLAQEGTPTDDGRQIEKGALVWRELPLTLMAITEDSHGGMPTNRTVVSGRIDAIERVDTGDQTADIIGTGVFDTGDNGAEIARLVGEKMLRGISIDLAVQESEEIIGSDVEGGVEDPMFGGSYLLVVKKGTILGATVCPFPAFGEADIETITASAGVLPRYAIPAMTLNADGHVVRMQLLGEFAPSDTVPPAPADDPDNDQDNDADPIAGSPVGITVMVDELPTADDLAGVDPTSLAVTYKGDDLSIASLTLADANDQTVDVPLGKPLTASAAGMVPVHPPAAWFDYPADVPEGVLVPLQITPDGRVYGHVAAFNECHIGIPGKCQIAPHHFRQGDKGLCAVCAEPELHVDHSRAAYDYFHLGEIETAEGELVRVGQLTIGTGHAATGRAVTAKMAQEHYENTGTAVADIHLYEDPVGVMCAGALRPDVAAVKVRETRGSKPSGDWRIIRGRREMVGLLGTNIPGYTIRRGISVADDGETRELALVAAGFVDTDMAGTKADCDTIEDLVARARMPALLQRARGISP